MDSKFYNEFLQKLDDLILCAGLNCTYGDIFHTSIVHKLLDIKEELIEFY